VANWICVSPRSRPALGDGELGFGIIDGLWQHEIGRLRAGFVEAFHLDLSRRDLGLRFGDVRLKFRHFERGEDLASFDGIAFIDADVAM
jgi:hypothetical protein